MSDLLNSRGQGEGGRGSVAHAGHLPQTTRADEAQPRQPFCCPVTYHTNCNLLQGRDAEGLKSMGGGVGGGR